MVKPFQLVRTFVSSEGLSSFVMDLLEHTPGLR